MEREGTDPAPVTDTVQERLTLSQLRTLCELARLGTSMTQAAERLRGRLSVEQPICLARGVRLAALRRLLIRRRKRHDPIAITAAPVNACAQSASAPLCDDDGAM